MPKRRPNKLEHGSFEAMVRTKLTFGPDVAQRLMAIARNPVLSKADHGRLLPPSYQTLYKLATIDKKLGDGTLQKLLADGTGRASELMQIADGRKTVAGIREKTAKRVSEHQAGSSLRNEEPPSRSTMTSRATCCDKRKPRRGSRTPAGLVDRRTARRRGAGRRCLRSE